MNRIRVLAIFCLVLLPVLCRADDYGYPIRDSYAATILQTPAELKPELPKDVPLKQKEIHVLPDFDRPDVFFYDEGLRCTVAYQKEKAPLVFLIAGTGASNMSPKLVTLTKALYQAGFHVVILPSPTNPNFIISASRSHVPGDLSDDAEDLYIAMQAARQKVSEDIQVSDFYLAGYSLGGTQAAFAARVDEERKVFNFRKVLLINPAVSLYNSISQIEGLLNNIPGGKKNLTGFLNATLTKFAEYYRRGEFVAFNDEFLYKVYQQGLLSRDETGGLIGLMFRIDAAGMIFSSDVMTNGGYVVPKNRILSSTDSLGDYFRVSAHLSYFDYFNEYFYPYFQKRCPGLTKQALIDAQSLKRIDGYLRSSPKIGVVTNVDDFILMPGEVGYLQQVFGDRAKIYPNGGHGGNFEYRDNIAYVVNYFRQ